MKSASFKVNNISCSNCAKTIKKIIKNKYADTVEVRINVNLKTVYVKYREDVSAEEIIATLTAGGYPVQINDTELGLLKRQMIISIILSIPLLIGMVVHLTMTENHFLMIFTNGYLQLIIAGFIQIYIGKRFYKAAYYNLRVRVMGMDLLVVIATTISYLYSVVILIFSKNEMPVVYFEVSTLVITIVLIGKYLEEKVKANTTQALTELLELKASTARLIVKNKTDLVAVEQLQLGDQIIVLKNEQIPIDGIIISGQTMVDEASFTGESIAVNKTCSDQVLGGTINLGSKIVIEVNRHYSDSALAQIIDAVKEASLTETKYQRIVDRVASIFVPVVIAIAILTYTINYAVTGLITSSLNNAISVILISCPCALGLATPTAIMVGNTIAAKRGILYKGGAFFEIGSKIDVICFDKTNTITSGELEVLQIDLADAFLPQVYALEVLSVHPISTAILKYLGSEVDHNLDVIDFKSFNGLGVSATVMGQPVLIGNINLMKKMQVDITAIDNLYQTYLSAGLTTNLIAVNNQVVGLYGVSDQIKPSSVRAIKRIHDAKIKTVMVTGDNPVVANIIASELAIDEVHSQILPIAKADIVKHYQQLGMITAFVGDGVNDSVALTQADIGIAVSGANSIAIGAADVSILKDDLNLIMDGILISKATARNIYQNLAWAFSYNIIAIPLAALGHLNMVLAATAMGFSSIVVVLNALRLKRLKFPDK